jgi:hypothetical protein
MRRHLRPHGFLHWNCGMRATALELVTSGPDTAGTTRGIATEMIDLGQKSADGADARIPPPICARKLSCDPECADLL